jgi:hypothetical protein
MRFDVQSRRKEESENVRPVWIVIGRWDQMLKQRIQLARYQIVILNTRKPLERLNEFNDKDASM